jgi:hypothetical protein
MDTTTPSKRAKTTVFVADTPVKQRKAALAD